MAVSPVPADQFSVFIKRKETKLASVLYPGKPKNGLSAFDYKVVGDKVIFFFVCLFMFVFFPFFPVFFFFTLKLLFEHQKMVRVIIYSFIYLLITCLFY
jgi:hypothetical protein